MCGNFGGEEEWGGVRYGEGDMQGIISGVFLVGGILVRASEP